MVDILCAINYEKKFTRKEKKRKGEAEENASVNEGEPPYTSSSEHSSSLSSYNH